MAWNEAVVTNEGIKLLSECVTDGNVIITGAVGGEQYSNPLSLIAQKEIRVPRHLLNIAYIRTEKGSITVNVRIQNDGVETPYYIKQIGLFAKSDKSEEEVLFALIQDKDGEIVPTAEENPEYLSEFDFVIPVSNAENIGITVTPNTFATLDDISELANHLKDNDRHITAEERAAWNSKAAGNHTHSAASQSAAGFMSAEDKKKLDGVAAGANAYTHPTASGSKHIPSGGSSGQILRWSADGTAAWGADNNTTYSAMTGASASAAGTAGLVPAPAKGKQTSFLRGDGTWAIPTDTTYSEMTGASASAAGTAGLVPAPAKGKQTSFLRGDGTWAIPTDTTYAAMTGASASAAGTAGLVPAPAKGNQAKYLRGDGTWQTPTNTTYSAASQSAAGLMSAADKAKLDGIEESANSYTHPSYTARTGVPTANQTPAFGGTFSVSQPVSDASGHITAINSRTVKIPNTEASASAAGLMSAEDKKKLDGVTLAAPVYMTASMGAAISFTVPTGSKAAIVILKTVGTTTNSSYGYNTVKDIFVDVIDVTAGDVSIHLWFNDDYVNMYGVFTRSNGNADHGIISLKDNTISFATGVYVNDCNDIPVNKSTYSSTFSAIFI